MSDDEAADWGKTAASSSDCCGTASGTNTATALAPAAGGAPAARGDEFIVEILSKLSQMTAPSTENALGRAPPQQPPPPPHGADATLVAIPECFEDYCYYDSCGSGSFVQCASTRDGHLSSDVPASLGRDRVRGQWGETARTSADGAVPTELFTVASTDSAEPPRFGSGPPPTCVRAAIGGERVARLSHDPTRWTTTIQTAAEAAVRTQTANAPYEAATDRDAFAMLASRVRRGGNQTHLWEFLLELLTDPAAYSSIISWENEEGTFCIKNPAELAAIWGHRRKRQNMTYEKLSRSLRHYYDKKILRKVPKRKYTYKFNCREILRTYDVPPAFRYHHQFRKRAAAMTTAAAVAAAGAETPLGGTALFAARAGGGAAMLLQPHHQATSSPPSPSPLHALCASLASPATEEESMDSTDSATDACAAGASQAQQGSYSTLTAASAAASAHQQCEVPVTAGARYRQFGFWSETDCEASLSPPPQLSSPPTQSPLQQQQQQQRHCGVDSSSATPYGYGQQVANRWPAAQLEYSTEAAARLRHDSDRTAAAAAFAQRGGWCPAAVPAASSVCETATTFGFESAATAAAWSGALVAASCGLVAQATSAHGDCGFVGAEESVTAGLAATCGGSLEPCRAGVDAPSALRQPTASTSAAAAAGLYGADWGPVAGLLPHQQTRALQLLSLQQRDERPLVAAFGSAAAAGQLVGRPHSAPEQFSPPGHRASAGQPWDGNHSAPGQLGRWLYPSGASGLDYHQ